MPLLELTAGQAKMLRECVDQRVLQLEAHRLRSEDPFVAAAIRADITEHIALRQQIVTAGKPTKTPRQIVDLLNAAGFHDHAYDLAATLDGIDAVNEELQTGRYGSDLAWLPKKAEYDRQQDADIEGGLVL